MCVLLDWPGTSTVPYCMCTNSMVLSYDFNYGTVTCGTDQVMKDRNWPYIKHPVPSLAPMSTFLHIMTTSIEGNVPVHNNVKPFISSQNIERCH